MELTNLHLHWRNSSYNGTTYKSYSLARPYREDGKNRKEIVVKLGKLTDLDIEKWRLFLKAIKKPQMVLTSFDDIEVHLHYKYLELAVINHIWDEWKLDNAFISNRKTDVELCKIAKILTLNRCCEPYSKSGLIDWYPKTWLPNMLNVNISQLNTSRVFRELSAIEDHKDEICQHLYQAIKKKNPESVKSLFYDLSSATFSGTKCIIMKWGHCKEGYQNHVVLALVVNKDGLPVFWEVLEGNTADAKTIKWLIQRIKKLFNSDNISIVFDRGMVSQDNLTELEEEGYKYISAMDKNQICNIADTINFNHFSSLIQNKLELQILENDGFKKLNDNTYFKEIKVEHGRRYIICFNPQLFSDQRKARDAAIVSFKEFVANLNTELLQALKSRDEKTTKDKFTKQLAKLKLKNILEVSLNDMEININTGINGTKKTIKTYQGVIEPIDNLKLIEASKLDGFWMLVTNHFEIDNTNKFIVSPENAINPYRDKTVIESAFRDIKSFIEIEPICVWTEKHVKAHYTICVLSYFINRIIHNRLTSNKGTLTSDIVSHEKAYSELSDCTVDKIRIKNVGLQGYKYSYIDDRKKELLKRLNLSKILKDKSVKIANKDFHNQKSNS